MFYWKASKVFAKTNTFQKIFDESNHIPVVYALVVLALFEPKIVHKKIDEIYSHLKHFNNKQKINFINYIRTTFWPKLCQCPQFIKYKKIHKTKTTNIHKSYQLFMNDFLLPNCFKVFILHTDQITCYLKKPLFCHNTPNYIFFI